MKMAYKSGKEFGHSEGRGEGFHAGYNQAKELYEEFDPDCHHLCPSPL